MGDNNMYRVFNSMGLMCNHGLNVILDWLLYCIVGTMTSNVYILLKVPYIALQLTVIHKEVIVVSHHKRFCCISHLTLPSSSKPIPK